MRLGVGVGVQVPPSHTGGSGVSVWVGPSTLQRQSSVQVPRKMPPLKKARQGSWLPQSGLHNSPGVIVGVAGVGVWVGVRVSVDAGGRIVSVGVVQAHVPVAVAVFVAIVGGGVSVAVRVRLSPRVGVAVANAVRVTVGLGVAIAVGEGAVADGGASSPLQPESKAIIVAATASRPK